MIARIRAIAESTERPRVRRLLIGLFLVIATTFTFLPFVRFLRHGTQFDYRTWFDAAQAVLQGREIYPRTSTFPFMYPPTCALLLAIPAIFGKSAMILLLTLANTAAWILCLKFCMSLTNESRFHTFPALVSSLIVVVFVWSSYHLGQPSLLLLALMLGAFVCLRSNRQIVAGTLVALAAVIKAFPLLAIIYLIYRRYWLATLALLAALVVLLFLLPLPVRGFSQTTSDLRAWQNGMLRYEQGGIAQRRARGYSWKNQSVFGLANRMLRRVSINDEGEPVEYANIADADFKTVNVVIIGIALVSGCLFLLAMPGSRNRESEGLEFGALLILILLFTPLAFGYLFSWLMLPLMLLTKRILTAHSLPALGCIITATTLLLFTAIAPRHAQVYGSVFFAALVLYFGVAIELWRVGSVEGVVER